MRPIQNIRTNVFRMKQAEFADLCEVTQGTVSKWERGEHEPDLTVLKRIRTQAIRMGMVWNDSLFFQDGETIDLDLGASDATPEKGKAWVRYREATLALWRAAGEDAYLKAVADHIAAWRSLNSQKSSLIGREGEATTSK